MAATLNSPVSKETWRESSSGGWAAMAVLPLLLACLVGRAFFCRRRTSYAPSPSSLSPIGNPLPGLSETITDAELKDLINQLEGGLDKSEKWEDVIDKNNGLLSYNAKFCRPKSGPLKYLSITTFEKCSTELLRDFYMDNEYRIEWDTSVTDHKQLQVDELYGIEIGRTIKKFPLLTPREYVLAWRVWEGKEKTYYCIVKDCDHPRAPRMKKCVRVQYFRSGWCIKKVPGRDACEIRMVHQEDGGMNVEMAKLAFSRGIWSYVNKMNTALRRYSSDRRSISVETMRRLVQKVPVELEEALVGRRSALAAAGRQQPQPQKQQQRNGAEGVSNRNPCLDPKWINGLLLLGGVICLSRSRSSLGARVAVACIVKKLLTRHDAAPVPPSSRAAKSPRL